MNAYLLYSLRFAFECVLVAISTATIWGVAYGLITGSDTLHIDIGAFIVPAFAVVVVARIYGLERTS